MKISVFRVYPRGKSANADSQHLFSILTTEECAHYATPNIADNNEWDAFNDERIQQALNLEDSPFLKRTPLITKTLPFGEICF